MCLKQENQDSLKFQPSKHRRAVLAVESASEKDVYRKIEKTIKKEQLSKRDDW